MRRADRPRRRGGNDQHAAPDGAGLCGGGGRTGESWRTQRWDAFRLNTPGWMNRLLGEQAHDAYATAAEVIGRLEQLAADRPVRSGVRVERLAPAGDGYALDTHDGALRARTVVVATGGPEPAAGASAGPSAARSGRALPHRRLPRSRGPGPAPPWSGARWR
jgi:cation diffusion facilitator CzcD-associated flavoprotein CzcO